MQFGVQFFPDVRPEEKSGETYFQEALDLAEEADRLGFSHIRIVEHYFHYYGGYSPNPIVFLAAAAQRMSPTMAASTRSRTPPHCRARRSGRAPNSTSRR